MAQAGEKPKIDDLKRLLRRLEQVSTESDAILLPGDVAAPTVLPASKDGAREAIMIGRLGDAAPVAKRNGESRDFAHAEGAKASDTKPEASMATEAAGKTAGPVVAAAATASAVQPQSPTAPVSLAAGHRELALTVPPPVASGWWKGLALGGGVVLGLAGLAVFQLSPEVAKSFAGPKQAARGGGDGLPDFAAGARPQQLRMAAAPAGSAASIAAVDAAARPDKTTKESAPTPPHRAEQRPSSQEAGGAAPQPEPAATAASPKGGLGESEVLRAQPASRGRDKFDAEIRLEAYLERGQKLIEEGDVTAARAFFRRVAESGDPRGALALGMSYDGNYFAELGIRGQVADPEAAGQWYRKAMDLGSKDALDRLERLKP